MSYIGRYPDVNLPSLTITGSKPIDSISSTTLGASDTAIATDAAIYNYINTFEITDFNASLSESNLIRCKTENRSTRPAALYKRNSNTCVLSSENFQCKYNDEVFVLNSDIDFEVPVILYDDIHFTISAIDSTKIDITYLTSYAQKVQDLDSKTVAFKHESGTCLTGKLIFKTETTGVIINIKYFNIIDELKPSTIISLAKLNNVMFSPKKRSITCLNGFIYRTNTEPQKSSNSVWLKVQSNKWYRCVNNQWSLFDGFLLGQIITDHAGIVACSTIDTQKLLVNFNNSLLQHNTYNVLNYHGNSHITVDKNIVEAPLNERLSWPRYQDFTKDTVYCYIDSYGQTYLEETLPIYKDNVEYLCHPMHYWRCIGYAKTESGKFTDVKTFDKTDFQTAVEAIYSPNQTLLEIDGNLGTNRVDKTGEYIIKQPGYYRIDLVGGGGGGAGDTHSKKVRHSWVTYSYSDNSFASQGSSGSYIAIKLNLRKYDKVSAVVGYGGRFKNGDAGESAIHGADSTCSVTSVLGNFSFSAPHGYTSHGLVSNHTAAQRAAMPQAPTFTTEQHGAVITRVQGAQGSYIYHEDYWYINMEGNVSPVNNEKYCWGAGGGANNSGHNSHNINDTCHGMGGWFKLTYLGPTV